MPQIAIPEHKEACYAIGSMKNENAKLSDDENPQLNVWHKPVNF